MAFNRDEVAKLLGHCHRRCCICHQFCGVKMETDHIIPKDEGGDDKIENAIPVCFECHAEIHSYNTKHPRGRKFTPDELTQHKEQWLKICSDNPEILIKSFLRTDVGPLNALVDELEYNLSVAKELNIGYIGCNFKDDQFKKAIQIGSISILIDELKSAIIDAYVAMGNVNHYLNSASKHSYNSGPWNSEIGHVKKLNNKAEPLIKKTLEELFNFLSKGRD